MPAPDPIRALGAPRRREILRLLRSGEQSAGELHRALPDVTFGAVSQHLRVLQEAGLVSVRAEGRGRFYRMVPAAIAPHRRWLAGAVGRRALRAEAGGGARGRPPRTARPRAQEETPMMLDHALERTVLIAARPATVFRFFTDPARFAVWWGAGSHIDARPGGAVHIRYPNGVVASGEVVEVVPDRRIVFTYGYEDAGKPIPPGGSRVTVTLEETARGRACCCATSWRPRRARDAHVPGWRYQLAIFANVAAAEQHAGTDARVAGGRSCC